MGNLVDDLKTRAPEAGRFSDSELFRGEHGSIGWINEPVAMSGRFKKCQRNTFVHILLRNHLQTMGLREALFRNELLLGYYNLYGSITDCLRTYLFESHVMEFLTAFDLN